MDEKALSPKATLIYDALIFGSWAGGEGVGPVDGEKVGQQGVNSPEDFFFEYLDQSGDDEGWDDQFCYRVAAEFDANAAELTRLRAENAALVEALTKLERTAREVHRLSERYCTEWVALAGAMDCAAALLAARETSGPGAREGEA